MYSLNRRSFLTQAALVGAASAVPFSLTGCGSSSGVDLNGGRGSGGGAPPENLTLTSYLNGMTLEREQVLQWEARRLQVVAQRMANNLPTYYASDLEALILRPTESTANIAQERNLLADAKIKAGDAAMRSLVANDLLVSDPVSSLAASSALGRYSPSVTRIVSTRGTAEGFSNWYLQRAIDKFDERAMLVACPDHYVLTAVQPKGQDVMEETGGALVVSHFTIDYNNFGNLPAADLDSSCPVRLAGQAVNGQGTAVGGVIHQFRNLEQGFEGHLAVYFPSTLPFWFVTEHAWHLACEFSNWITSYVVETGD